MTPNSIPGSKPRGLEKSPISSILDRKSNEKGTSKDFEELMRGPDHIDRRAQAPGRETPKTSEREGMRSTERDPVQSHQQKLKEHLKSAALTRKPVVKTSKPEIKAETAEVNPIGLSQANQPRSMPQSSPVNDVENKSDLADTGAPTDPASGSATGVSANSSGPSQSSVKTAEAAAAGTGGVQAVKLIG